MHKPMVYWHGSGHLFTLLIFVFILASCQQETPIQTIRAVRVEQVQLSHGKDRYAYAGVVTARENINVSFQVGGKIARREVEVGDTVTPGQLLAVLDPKDLELNVKNAEEDVESSESALALSQSDLARYEPLVKKGFISKSMFEQVETKNQTNKNNLDKAKSNLSLAKRQLGYAKVYAEYPGIIIKIFANAGQVVSAGQSILEMALGNPSEIIIHVPEQRINLWRNIKNVNFILWAYPDKNFTAKIREIAGEADPETRTYKVKLSIDQPQTIMKLGMSATVQVDESNATQPVITLPLTAIAYESRQPIVWICNIKTMTVHPAKVVLGEFKNNRIIIKSGLQVGQWVVTAGVNSLRPGQKVKLLHETN